MKILTRNSDSVVLYADDSLVLHSDRVTGDGWQDFNFTTANATIFGATPPDFWCGGNWTYVNGVWTVVSQAEQGKFEAVEAPRREALAAKQTAEFVAAVTEAAQARLDTFAQTRGYDGVLSACTYAPSTVANFAVEGQYCVDARDGTWATLYTVMGEVQVGTRPMPASVEAVMELLPVLAWPA